MSKTGSILPSLSPYIVRGLFRRSFFNQNCENFEKLFLNCSKIPYFEYPLIPL